MTIRHSQSSKPQSQQNGIALIVILLILVIVSIIGAASIQISRMSTQAARNERDIQIAWQSAEAALLDAEMDILGKSSNTTRASIFDRKNFDIGKFEIYCSSDQDSRGLCKGSNNAPAWLNIDFLDRNQRRYAEFGEFTGRVFVAGSSGIQPAYPPRYIIEAIEDLSQPNNKNSEQKYLFRVTAVGFGPNEKTQVVLQSVFRN